MDQTLARHYYGPRGYWKGSTAIKELVKVTSFNRTYVQAWLRRQALWQIYLPPPKYVPRFHWSVQKVNQVHQADLLYLPHDTWRRRTHKYAIVVVDVASRYVDAEPLTSKYSTGVAKGFEEIYSRRLKWPRTLIVDPGTEFMGEVTKIMKEKSVHLQRSEANNHRAQALVERANRTLAKRLFSYQYAREMNLEGNERSREWVERLPAVLRSLNHSVKRITGKTSLEALRSKDVPSHSIPYKRPVGFEELTLPPGVQVRYLYAPGELEGGSRRATDPVWSLETYYITRAVVSADQPVLYYLSEGAPRRNFVREELQVVPDDTELPKDS